MSRTVLRKVIPVDDQWHIIEITGDVLHIAARTPGEVDVWFIYDTTGATQPRCLRVFGTGQRLEDEATYVGTAVAGGIPTPVGVGRGLVWHLFEIGAPTA